MNTDKVKLQIVENADKIAKIIQRGNDVEIRHDVSGVKIIEVKKAVVR